MRILFLTSRIPFPPVGGDRLRVFHILRTAAEAGHDVDLVTFVAKRPHPLALEPLRRLTSSLEVVPLPKALSWWRAMSALPSRFPLQAAYYRSARMSRAVSAAIERTQPDVVYTHLFRMAPYALAARNGHDTRWILDLTDVISAGIARSLPFRRGPQQWLYREEGARIARYEAHVAPRFDECWVISAAEARSLGALAPRARVRVVPNGFEPDGDGAVPVREAARLLFFGFHGVFHNRDAAYFLANDVLPRVRAVIPDATLAIAGKGAESLGSGVRRPGVRVLGFVPDLEHELRRATVFVAPHRFASGVQNKVVQAMAAGTPVVTTPIVRQGLDPLPDETVRVGADAEAIAGHIVQLLRDPATADRLGARGRAWVAKRFTWRASLDAFEEIDGAPPVESPHPAPARLAVVGV